MNSPDTAGKHLSNGSTHKHSKLLVSVCGCFRNPFLHSLDDAT